MSAESAEQVLLDTCALIWLVHGDPITSQAQEAIVSAGLAGGVLVSPVNAWEVGMLATKPTGPRFLPDPKAWFAQVLTRTVFHLVPLTPDIAIDSSYLPGQMHGDPFDRMLVSTARARRADCYPRLEDPRLCEGRFHAGRPMLIGRPSSPANDNRSPEELVEEVLDRWRRARAIVKGHAAKAPPAVRPTGEPSEGDGR